MNRLDRFWLTIAIVTFCLGIAIGRFGIPTGTTKPAVDAESPRNHQSSAGPTNAATVQNNSDSKDNSRADFIAGSQSDRDIYSQIKDSLTANGTARLYDSFGRFSNLIDQKNVRDVLAFADKIPKKEQKDALTSLVIARWAEFDPKSALEFAQDISTLPSRTSAMGNALSAWAQRDSASAIAWAQQMAPGPARDQTIHAVLSGLSEK